MSGFDNKYDSKIREKEIREFWDKNNIYKFDEKSKKSIFSIDTPPPTMSGKMHIGHAFSYTQADFVARYKRMNGFNVYYPFGTDDNGLPTEKLVMKEKKVDLRRMPRDEAVKITMEYLDSARPDFIQDWKNIGVSCDFDYTYSTISPYAQKITQKTFLELYKKGLIEQKEGPVPWDRKFQTPIAQAELEDVTRKAFLNYVKAKIVETDNTYMIYATTRPELCFAVVGMSIEDNGEYVKLKVGKEFWITGAQTYMEKFSDIDYEVVEKLTGQDLIGQKVNIPFVNKEVEVSHDISVKADFGTGIAYFCTYGGLEDKEWAERHSKEPVSLLDTRGKLNKLGGKYEGMIAEDARRQIIKDMEDDGCLFKKEEKEQIVNVGERSGVEVEYIVAKQWYVKYLDKKEHFWEMCQKFNWKPEFMKVRLENWIKGLNWDWGFSRQRHFGIPIPVWFGDDGKIYLPDESELPVDPMNYKPKKAPKGVKLTPETDVMDTWFTSSSSPELAVNMVKDAKMRKKLFPMSMRPQAHDIISTWLFYTMAKTNLLYNMNPFETIPVSGFVLDPQGKKMSKSKGNTIVPQLVVDKYSNDGLRFAAGGSKLGQDIPYQEKEVQSGVKIANKLYNACKFAEMLLKDFDVKDKDFNVKELRSIDKWVLAKMNKTIENATISFENFDYSKVRNDIEYFFMHNVADNYLEIVKQRLWKPEEFGIDEAKKAQKALYVSLFNTAKGLSPFMPYITEEVYDKFFSNYETEKSIHLTSWPKINKDYDNDEIIELGDAFVSVVAAVRKFKSEKQISMKEEVKVLTIECDKKVEKFISDSLNDLKNVTNTTEIKFGKGKIETGVLKTKIDIKL